MKILSFLLILVVGLTQAQESSNYTITINGEPFDYILGKDFQYNVKKKGELSIKVSQKEVLTYNDGIVTFNHSKNFPVSESLIDDTIKQITVIGATGSGVIIQEYSDFDPALMVDLMLNEVTKESIDYGYTETASNIEIKTKDGKTLKGKKSILEYQGEIDEWIVVTYSWKDSGILIVGINIDKKSISDGGDINVKNFFESLEIIKQN